MQIQPSPDHSTTTQPATQPADGHAARIVVGVDGTHSALNAVRWAAAEARARGAALRILHAAPYASGPEGPGSMRVRSILGVAYTAARRTAPDVDASTGSSTARPVDALLAAAETAQLLVVGIPTETPSVVLPSSVAVEVAGRASCPVAVVRGRTRAEAEPVLVGIDDPDSDAAALDAAFAEAELHRCGLVVLHARSGLAEHLPGHTAHDERHAARLGAALAERSARHPEVEVSTRTPAEDPITALLAAAHHARLLVVGTRHRGTTARALFGSHSRAMLRHSPVPVLVVDPDVRTATRSPATRPPTPAPQT